MQPVPGGPEHLLVAEAWREGPGWGVAYSSGSLGEVNITDAWPLDDPQVDTGLGWASAAVHRAEKCHRTQ